MLPKLIEYLENRSVMILGFGREGQSTYNYIRKYLPRKLIAVCDEREQKITDENVTAFWGKGWEKRLGDYDTVIKSPGIPFATVEVPENAEITCQTDLFMRFAPCKKIGVSGTKGKTTTSTLIYKMLCAGGVNCRLMGNMGLPALDFIDEAVEDITAVIELSSHQLEFMRKSPNIAVLTNIYEEHLEHYKGGMQGYVNAKLNIVRHQGRGDVFIYNGTQGLGDYIDLNSVQSDKIPVFAEDKLPFELTNPRLQGRHYYMDALMASAAAQRSGVDISAVQRGIEDFEGIEHRMEPLGEFKGIKFYNDCIATIPRAAICAVEASNADTIIIGGLDRGIDYTDFAVDLENSRLSLIIGTKTTGHKIIDMMQKNGSKKRLVKAENLEEAVKSVYELSAKGTTCILSPAAASYNEYKNFEEKGRHYKELVKRYGGEK